MSSSPPPGWYRDPSYPLTERWWDGSAWTDHRRQPVQPPVPPPVRPRPNGLGRTKVVALAVTGAVLAAGAVTGGVLVLGGDGDGGQETRTAPTAPSSGGGSPSPTGPSSSPSKSAGGASVVVDDLNGITFPVLDGWTDGEDADEDAVLVTEGTYDCPGDDGLCRSGWVYSRTVTQSDETSPKVLAEKDIEDAANDAYDRDDLDRRPYNGITGHEVVASGSVAVAGRAGYFVRWRVTTEAGPGGYVQSLVFPSSVGSEAPVLVRFAVDAGDEGPPVGDIDRIVKGIRAVGDEETAGGVGSSLGPQ